MNKIGVKKCDYFFVIFIIFLVVIFFSYSTYQILFDSNFFNKNNLSNYSKITIPEIVMVGNNIHMHNFEFDEYLIDIISKKAEFVNQKNLIHFYFAYCKIMKQDSLLGTFNSSFFSIDIQNYIVFSSKEVVGSFSNLDFHFKNFSYYVNRKELLVFEGFSLSSKKQELNASNASILVKEKKIFLSGGVYSEFYM